MVPSFSLASKSDKFTVIYAGAHGLANDLETVLHAAKMLQDQFLSNNIHILLIGEGPEKSRLKQFALTHKINIVEFIDSVAKSEIYSILHQADAFLMLLKNSPVFRWGISPNKLFDYLAMGRPIIFGVNSSYNPVKDISAGININPGDPAALAHAIYSLSLLAKDELHQMGLRGRQFVLENHHIQKLTDILENLTIEVATSF
jgi:glycosyltransferase involved in cell wall biosynthesis